MSVPHFESTLRGGSGSFRVARKVRPEYDTPNILERFVFLVHGYNVGEDAAFAEFNQFTESITRSADALRGQVVYLTWPGDYKYVISRLSYPWRVWTARQCAPKFAEYLESLGAPHGGTPKIVIIAHSLGCRLALEAVSALTDRVRRNVTLIIMAAAYPVRLIRDAMSVSVRSTHASVVFYSEADSVLGTWFAPGEFFARTSGGGLAEAVGLCGRPTRRAWNDRLSMNGFDHGDYWTSDRVHAQVLRILGFPAEISLQDRGLREVDFTDRRFSGRSLSEHSVAS